MHERNCFITLTYDPRKEPEGGSVRVKDFQMFMKRMRKDLEDGKTEEDRRVRYFHCGEYGEKSSRPHYHALLFGVDFSLDGVPIKRERGHTLFKSGSLDRLWGLGHASVGSLTMESAAYVARYVMKKDTAETGRYGRIDHNGDLFFVRPEYVTMSRRPGIGSKWFEQFASEVYPSDEVVHEGKRYRPPRFYDSKLAADVLLDLKGKRRQRVSTRGQDLTEDRLRVREVVAAARLSGLHRSL